MAAGGWKVRARRGAVAVAIFLFAVLLAPTDLIHARGLLLQTLIGQAGGHVHDWEETDNVTGAIYETTTTARTSELVPVHAYGFDWDRCLNYGGYYYGGGGPEACPFPENIAINTVVAAAWTDGGAGGAFGFVDANGQFVEATDPADVTTYRSPSTPGDVVLSVTLDDIPEATDPDTGETVTTRDDAPITATFDLTITGTPSHTHQWMEFDNLPPAWIGASDSTPEPGQVVSLTAELTHDVDWCVVSPGCPFPNNTAENDLQITGWSDGGAGGTFGFIDAYGQFQTTTDPGLVTAYRCGSSGPGGTVTLTATIDDLPEAIDPETGQPVPTYDDAAVTASVSVEVAEEEDHSHDWEGQDNVPEPAVGVDASEPQPGQVVPVGLYAQWDHDLCLDSDGLPCGFPQDTAFNGLKVTAWSDNGAGGEFGFLDGEGQFQPSTDPNLVTHYRLPADGTGVFAWLDPALSRRAVCPSSATITLTATVDDIPHDTEQGTGRTVPTYDDVAVTGSVSFSASSSAGHQHNWEQVDDIPAPSLAVSDYTPAGHGIIRLQPHKPGMDVDPCVQEDDSFCPFHWYISSDPRPSHGLAYNETYFSNWTDDGGGEFGYLDAQQQFVAVDPAASPDLVTHYRCPSVTTDRVITLKVWVDDHFWQISEPLTDHLVNTRDDANTNAHGDATITVQGAHGHLWDGVQNLPIPGVTVSDAFPDAGEVINVSAGFMATETDHCLRTSPQCSYGGNTATNNVRLTEWTDHGGGGTFGRWQNGQFVAGGAADQINAYQCPSPQSGSVRVTLTAKVDDDDVNGDTFNDDAKTGDYPITIGALHKHSFSSTGNTANVTTTLGGGGAQTLQAGAIVPVHHGTPSHDTDLCGNAGCCFPSDGNGHFVATEDGVKLLYYQDDCKGAFGFYDAHGVFQKAQPDQIDLITHYQVGKPAGLDADHPQPGHVWIYLEDVGEASDCQGGGAVMTVRDGAKDGDKFEFTITDGPGVECKSKRGVDKPHVERCTCDKRKAHSSVQPRSGRLSFEVPVTHWSYKGLDLGLTLSYDSFSRADPLLDSEQLVSVNPMPEFAHLSHRNSHWTHTWAQFIEVVDEGNGEAAALWYTGDGGTRDFQMHTDENGHVTWDDVHKEITLTSSAGLLVKSFEIKYLRFTAAVPYPNFTATMKDGTRYEFTKVSWEAGPYVAIPYFLLTKVTDRFGRVVTLDWTVNDETQRADLNSVRDSNGRGLAFAYSGGLLRRVFDPAGRSHTFTYTGFESDAGTLENKLSGAAITGPGNVTYNWQFGYAGPYAGDLLTSKTEPSGKKVTYTYEAVNLTGTPPRPDPRDWDGRVLTCSYTDAKEGNRVKTITRDPNSYSLTYPGGRTLLFGYCCERDMLSSVQDLTTGRTVHYAYDGRMRLTATWLNGGLPLQIKYTDAEDGTLLKTETDFGERHRTETLYGAFEQPWKFTAFRKATNSTLPYDQITQGVLDSLGRLTQVTAAVGTPLQNTGSTAFTYQWDMVKTVTDVLGRTASTVYDGQTGYPLQSLSPANAIALNPGDRASSIVVLTYNLDGTPKTVRDPDNRISTFTYSPGPVPGALRVTVTQGAGAEASSASVVLDAAGQPVQVFDAKGVETDVVYNGDGQVLTVTEAVGKPEQRTTSYAYNVQGDLISLTPPRGTMGMVRFDYRHYDEESFTAGTYTGELGRITHPDGTEEFFGYDDDGLPAWEGRPYSDATGWHWSVIHYTVDDEYRVTDVHYPVSPQGLPGYNSHLEYDDFGRVSSVSDITGTTTRYEYDALGRVSKVIPSGGRKTATIAYVPDLTNHRWVTRTTLAGITGDWIEREDSKGRLAQVVNPLGQLWNFSYLPGGGLLTQSNGNRTSSSYAYDTQGRLKTILHNLTGTTLDRLTYAYDANGRVLSETDSGGRAHRFSYDNLGRLIDEKHPDLGTGGIQYRYDPNDNRTSVVRNGVTEYYGVDKADKLLWVNADGNRAPTSGQTRPYSLFEYDEFGQMVRRDRVETTGGAKQVLDFLWDADGRLGRVRKGATQLFSATYDSGGERFAKHDDQTGDHLDSFGLHDTNAGTLNTPGLAQRKGGIDRFLHQDWLGSTRYLTNQAGATPSSALRFDAYGRQSALAGTDSFPTEQQYAGYAREPAGSARIGLDYLSQRYYDPLVGRFISRDPIGWAGGLNLYGYTGNDPVNATDPSGLNPGLLGEAAVDLLAELGISAAEAGEVVEVGEAIELGPLGLLIVAGVAVDYWNSRPKHRIVCPKRGVHLFNSNEEPTLPTAEGGGRSGAGRGGGRRRRPPTRMGPRNPLTKGQKNSLRWEGKKIWERAAGFRADDAGLEVHHRIPLEWAHLMPGHPNRLSNLIGVDPPTHDAIDSVWAKFKTAHPNPTESDIMRQALEIDRAFAGRIRVLR